MVRAAILRTDQARLVNNTPKAPGSRIRCAIYTRKSSEEGLDQSFNSLDAQREACEAYIQSQRHEGWTAISDGFDDGGFSGGNMDRPALARLMHQIKQGLINVVVVYKVDRLSRSLADFVRLIDLFDRHQVSFVSVTQQFNTSASMGRLTLNVLLSFAQFEREVTGERIRDKIAASKQKGLWMGGVVPLGYEVKGRKLVVNRSEAETVRHIYARYLVLGNVRTLKKELEEAGVVSKVRQRDGLQVGGTPLSRGALYKLLQNPLYVGRISHKGKHYPGQHAVIVDPDLWDRVQQHLAQNRSHNKLKTVAKDPSLLAGRVFDDNHHPMSPTHTRKGHRRYRYYVSQAVLRFREQAAGSVIRVPAQPIEERVVAQLKQLLTHGHQLVTLFQSCRWAAQTQKQVIARARKLASEWDVLPFRQQIELIKRLISKVVVGRAQIVITVNTASLAEELLGEYVEGQAKTGPDSLVDHTICVPVDLKRCGIETRLVVPSEDQNSILAHYTTIHAIRQAVIKALTWNQALIDGSVGSMTELARQNGVTQRYVAHLLKLAFLAPDIIKVIIRGQVPADLSLDRLKAGFPLDWDEQRKVLGFPR